MQSMDNFSIQNPERIPFKAPRTLGMTPRGPGPWGPRARDPGPCLLVWTANGQTSAKNSPLEKVKCPILKNGVIYTILQE